jgi:bifunctional aspartokinase / homoserine dehydrogenase 1
MKKTLRVMKFGGTSVGDPACIARAAQIVAEAARESAVVVVVSAMGGVTDRLVEAATQAEAGDRETSAGILNTLRDQHKSALQALVERPEPRAAIADRLTDVLAEGQRLCDGTALLRELTPRTLDSISSLGEKLSAPLVAGTLAELGVPSEAVNATELIVTDPYHGRAEPLMDLTRERSVARLRPLLE